MQDSGPWGLELKMDGLQCWFTLTAITRNLLLTMSRIYLAHQDSWETQQTTQRLNSLIFSTEVRLAEEFEENDYPSYDITWLETDK